MPSEELVSNRRKSHFEKEIENETTTISNEMNTKKKMNTENNQENNKETNLDGDPEDGTDGVAKRKRLRSVTPPLLPKRCRLVTEEVQFFRNFLEIGTRVDGLIDHFSLPQYTQNGQPIAFNELKLYPKCKIDSPKCVYISPRECGSYDLCKIRTLNKDFMDVKILRAAAAYKSTIKTNKEARQLEKSNVYPKCLYDFTERWEQRPTEYFNGKYDYYYTSGNLCVLPTTQHVVHVDGESLTNLNISKFNYLKPKGLSRLETCSSQLFNSSSEIFEVSPIYIQKKENEDCFALRQENLVLLCSWQPEENSIKSLFQFKAKKIPFISLCQAEKMPDYLLISNMEQQIRLYNLSSGLPDQITLYKHNQKDLNSNGWNCVRHWENQNYLFANDKRLSILDTRTSANQWFQRSFRHSQRAFQCDSISCLASSKIENFIYIGTNHKLHCVDLRKLGDSFESTGAVCSWSHMLEYPPQFIENLKIKSTEYITLGSCVPGDLKVCELYRSKNLQRSETNMEKYLYKSYSLSYEPPTIQEAYDVARLSGICIEPKADVKRRILYSNTGLKYFKKPDDLDYLLLFSTSMGDVFAQNFSKRDPQDLTERRTSKRSNKYIKSYGRNLVKVAPRTLNNSSFADFQVMRKILQCETLSKKVIKEDPDEAEDDKVLIKKQRLGRWHKSLQALNNYKDALVPSLLSIWDIDCEPDTKIYIKDEKLKGKPDSDTKVTEWLKNMEEKPPMTSIPMTCIPNDSINNNAIDALLDSILKNENISPSSPNRSANLKTLSSRRKSPLPSSSNFKEKSPNKSPKTISPLKKDSRSSGRITRSSKNLITMLNNSEVSASIPSTVNTTLNKIESNPLNASAVDNSLIDFSQTSLCFDSFSELPHSTQIVSNINLNETSMDLFPPNDNNFIDSSGIVDRRVTSFKDSSQRKQKRKTKFLKGFF